MNSITIVHYSKEFENKHIEFASNYWTKRRRKEPEYIYWKFRGNSNNPLNSFILALENDRVVGQLGLIPCKIDIDGQIYDTQWACDLMVDKEYRGKNVANKLYEYAHSLKPLTLGSDPSPAASMSMKRKGYKSLAGPWKHLFPIKIGELTKLKKRSYKILDFLYNPFFVFYFFLGKVSQSEFERVKKNDYVDLINVKTKKAKILRDKEFVDWRFSSFMDFYSGVEIFTKSNHEVFYSGYFAGATYYITDYKTKNIFNLIQIIANIIQRFRDKDILRIRFCNNEHAWSKWLVFFGIIKFRTQTEIIYYTNDVNIKEQLKNKKFYYTFLDSDENI